MNEELFRQQDARGRLIAHMFYSELEKIAKVRMVTDVAKMTVEDLASSIGLLKKQVRELKAMPQAGLIARIRGTRGHDATQGGIRSAEQNLKELNAEISRRVTAARGNLPSGDSEVRHQAMKDLKALEGIRGGKAPASNSPLPTSSPPPKPTNPPPQPQPQPQPGAGATPPTLAQRVGQGTMAVGAAGALYGGYKMSKKPPADPYAQQQYGQY